MSIEDRVKQTVARALLLDDQAIRELGLHSTPQNTPNWNSPNHLNIVLELEQEFEITVPDDVIPTLVDVQAIVQAVERLI